MGTIVGQIKIITITKQSSSFYSALIYTKKVLWFALYSITQYSIYTDFIVISHWQLLDSKYNKNYLSYPDL